MRAFATILVGIAVASCGSGHSTSSANSPAASACEHYFDELNGGACGGVPLPAGELARQRARFVASCEDQVALPGAIDGAASVVACADALAASGCRNDSAVPECSPAGSLGSGAACNESSQCASNACNQAIGACGTCEAIVADGMACDNGTVCGPISQCDTSAGIPGTCVPGTAPTGLPAGAMCSPGQCQRGLVCSSASGKCAPPAAAGGACVSYFDCAYPLWCNSNLVCQAPGPAGTSCEFDNECAAGLGCGGTTCQTIAWVGAGATCDAANRCLVGECAPNGKCPTVHADGATCDRTDQTTTCDAYSVCFMGKCGPPDGAVCR